LIAIDTSYEWRSERWHSLVREPRKKRLAVCGSMATPVFTESGNAVYRVAHAGILADQHKPLIFKRCMMSRARTPARNNLGTGQNGDFLQRRRPPSKIQ